jgi:hypothetical protein
MIGSVSGCARDVLTKSEIIKRGRDTGPGAPHSGDDVTRGTPEITGQRLAVSGIAAGKIARPSRDFGSLYPMCNDRTGSRCTDHKDRDQECEAHGREAGLRGSVGHLSGGRRIQRPKRARPAAR